jgi:hypothetical protein
MSFAPIATHVRAARASTALAVAEKVRSVLASGPASEGAIVMVAHARRELVHDALRALLVRGEVARAGRGYCLVPQTRASVGDVAA